jgi:hypothetical protein
VAPRIGVAYKLSASEKYQTVVRGGFGTFYDLASAQVGNSIGSSYPFQAVSFCPDPSNSACPSGNLSFPLSPAVAAPPPITTAGFSSGASSLHAFDPHLRLPHTLEWNFALEQGIGKDQTVSLTYVGAAGRRLLQSAFVISPNSSFPSSAILVGNTAKSDYDALQLQFHKRLSRGLQALTSYSWSHSIDDGSTASFVNPTNTFVPGINPNANRGPSDFDVRNAFSAAVSYDIPGSGSKAFLRAISRGWSLENIIQARSAPPVDVYYEFLQNGFVRSFTRIRPDIIPGVPAYLSGSQYPGGKALNPAAFATPPIDPNTGLVMRQGNLGRNALRGFGLAQWDFAVHRDFPIRESVKLQFRAELFNVLNHPNFGPPSPFLDLPNFGLSTQMLGQSIGGGAVGGGTFNPLYQLGGPRSIQVALKLFF